MQKKIKINKDTIDAICPQRRGGGEMTYEDQSEAENAALGDIAMEIERVRLQDNSHDMFITKFRGKYSFLSNFYSCEVMLDGVKYPTIENAFQASKTLDRDERVVFQTCTPVEAKKLGYKVSLRQDWEYTKDSIMFGLLVQKFIQNETFNNLLMQTMDKYIIEGNNWGDRYWGCEMEDNKWVGKNKLGRMIMIIREYKNFE